MKITELREQIAAGATGPLYLLEGDDPQSRQEVASAFAALVDEGLQAFNVQSFHAGEATSGGVRDQLISEVLTAARTLPMMAPRRVLYLYEADRLLSPRKGRDDDRIAPAAESGRKKKRILSAVEELEAYLATPEPLTTLVFVAGPLDAGRRLVKLVRKHATIVQCSALASAGEAAAWVKARLEGEGLAIEPQAMALLLQATGLQLGRLRAEVDKLALFAADEKAITAQHVKELLPSRADEAEDFAFLRAIWNSNAREALRELDAQLNAGVPALLILARVRSAVARLRGDDQIKRGIDAVFRTDIALKSSGGEPRYLLECLVIEVCGR